MGPRMTIACTASEIARFLQSELRGPDVEVRGPRALDAVVPGALVFAKALSAERVERLNACPGALALVGSEFSGRLIHSHVIVPNARLAFARVADRFFTTRVAREIAASAVVDPSAFIGADVAIGRFSTIGPGVTVGDGTVIRDHVVLSAGTSIGRACLIKSRAVIGEEGFGFDFDEGGSPVRIPHLGGVEIGDDVEIGVGSVIARGTLDSTQVHNRVKIDDLVFIAHNVVIGEDTLVIANAEISGSAKIGRGCWIGPSASLINGVSVGDRAYVGIGAVVLKDVAPDTVVVGNPARFLRMRDAK